MSYRTRERKRKRRAAQTTAQRSSRNNKTSQDKWWLTITIRKQACARCGGILSVGHDMVYRHVPCECVCPTCADAVGIKWKPSIRWERTRRPKQAKTMGEDARRAVPAAPDR